MRQFQITNDMRLTKELYFITSTVVGWVDVFTRPTYRHIVLDSLRYCQTNKGLVIHAWVLMSNHLHLIASTAGHDSIGDIMRDFKKFTSKKILEAIEQNVQESRREWLLDRFRFAGMNNNRITNYHFWQDGNHVEEIYTMTFLHQKIDYIHHNPVRAEIVVHPEDYLYSSASVYSGSSGLIDVSAL